MGGLCYSKEFKKEVVDYRRTHKLKDTAVKFGVSYESIGRWSKEFGFRSDRLKAKHRISANEKRIVKDLENSVPWEEIREKYGISSRTINRLRVKHSIESEKDRMKRLKPNVLARLKESTLSAAGIGAEFGIRHSTVIKWANKADVPLNHAKCGLTDAQEAEVRRRVVSQEPTKLIANDMGLCVETVHTRKVRLLPDSIRDVNPWQCRTGKAVTFLESYIKHRANNKGGQLCLGAGVSRASFDGAISCFGLKTRGQLIYVEKLKGAELDKEIKRNLIKARSLLKTVAKTDSYVASVNGIPVDQLRKLPESYGEAVRERLNQARWAKVKRNKK